MAKNRKKNRRFAEEEQVNDQVTLDVKVLDEEGNPVEESSMTEEQKEFCAKVARAKYKKFSKSKVKKFSAEDETIEVTLPDNFTDIDPDQVAEDALTEREANDAIENIGNDVTVEMPLNDPEEDPTDVAEVIDELKEFTARLKKAKKAMKKFNAEEVEEATEDLQEAIEDAKEVLEDIAPEEPAEEEVTVTEACEQFAAALKKAKKLKKFTEDDVDKVEEVLEDAQETLEDLKGTDPVSDPEPEVNFTSTRKFNAGRQKNFTAGNIVDRIIGEQSLASFKQNFFNANK